jgi:hypothetical protein
MSVSIESLIKIQSSTFFRLRIITAELQPRSSNANHNPVMDPTSQNMERKTH